MVKICRPTDMQISPKGIAAIMQFESFRSKPYNDGVDVITIGYGSTYYPDGRKVTLADKPVDEPTARKIFDYILQNDFVGPLNDLFVEETKAGKITQNMFDAMCSLAYNIGMKNFKTSSVYRYTKQGNYKKAADSFALWNKAGGKVLKGLVRRRANEAQTYLA